MTLFPCEAPGEGVHADYHSPEVRACNKILTSCERRVALFCLARFPTGLSLSLWAGQAQRVQMSFWSIFGGKRHTDFFELLPAQAENTLEGCEALEQFLAGKGAAEEVDRLEREADDIRRIIIDELNQTFITPIDREDIFALSGAIDDAMDHAKNSVKEMMVFEVQSNVHLRSMAALLHNGAEQIAAAIRHLKKKSQRGGHLRSPGQKDRKPHERPLPGCLKRDLLWE